MKFSVSIQPEPTTFAKTKVIRVIAFSPVIPFSNVASWTRVGAWLCSGNHYLFENIAYPNNYFVADCEVNKSSGLNCNAVASVKARLRKRYSYSYSRHDIFAEGGSHVKD